MPTFADILTRRVSADPGRPLVTYYDHASAERTELSVVTYANWVAKTAGFLAEACDLERGEKISIGLGTHWLTPIFLGAAWSVGCVVSVDEQAGDEADALVVGPDGLTAAAASEARVKIASAMHPLGLRFSEPLPEEVIDFGAEVWSQPDSFIAYDPPSDEDEAVDGISHRQLWSADFDSQAAGGHQLLSDGARLLTTLAPTTRTGLAGFSSALLRDGSVVWVRNPEQDRMAEVARVERSTHCWT